MNPIIPNDVLYLYIITDKVIGLAWLLMIFKYVVIPIPHDSLYGL